MTTTRALRPPMFAIGQVLLYPIWRDGAEIDALTSVIGDYHFGEYELEAVTFHIPNFMFKHVKKDEVYDIATRLHCRFNGLKGTIRHIDVEQKHGFVAVKVVKDFRITWTETIALITGNITWFCSRSTWEPHFH